MTSVFRGEQLGETLRQVFLHWNAIRGERVMPARHEIDPTEFGRALSRIWIYEREDDDEFRCRLAGEEINAAYGRSIQGALARDLVGPKYDELVLARWNYVLDQAAFYHGYSADSSSGEAIERMCLPLADKDGKPRFVFGASQYFDYAAPRLYQDTFQYVTLHVSFYRIPTLERITEGAPA